MVIFQDGQVGTLQETAGDFSAWTGTVGVPSIDATTSHHGTKSFKATGAVENYCYKDFASAHVIYMRVYAKVVGALANNNSIRFLCAQENGGWPPTFGLKFIKTGDAYNISILDPSGDHYTVYDFGDDVIHCYEIKIDVTDHANAVIEAWIDGVSLGTQTSDTGNTNQIGRISVGQVLDKYNIPVYSDCVVVDSSYIGPEAAGATVKKGGSPALMNALLSGRLFD